MWKETAEEDTAEYNELAAKDKIRYEEEMEVFEASPRGGSCQVLAQRWQAYQGDGLPPLLRGAPRVGSDRTPRPRRQGRHQEARREVGCLEEGGQGQGRGVRGQGSRRPTRTSRSA